MSDRHDGLQESGRHACGRGRARRIAPAKRIIVTMQGGWGRRLRCGPGKPMGQPVYIAVAHSESQCIRMGRSVKEFNIARMQCPVRSFL